MKVAVSRSYFGRSAHTLGPGAYLSIEVQDGAQPLPALRECLPDLLDALGLPRDAFAASPCRATEASEPLLPRLLRLAIEKLLTDAGVPATTHVEASRGGHTITLTIATPEPEVAQRAGELTVKMLRALPASCTGTTPPAESGFDFRAEREALIRLAQVRSAPLTSGAIAAVAAERGIPVLRLDRWPFIPNESEVPPSARGRLQLGWGRHLRQMTGTALASVSPQIHQLLEDRQAAVDYLAKAGVRMPARDPEFTNLNKAQRAVRSARGIGFPVVVKPRRRAPGQTISLNLMDEGEVASAYERASRFDRAVVVEKHVSGDTFRLLLIGGNVVAARRKWASDDRDSDSPQFVPAGGDLSPRVHPEIRALAAKAATTLHLEVAEVVVVTSDISKPLEVTGGAVVDVDAAPDLAPYRMEGELLPKITAGHLVEHLFPRGTPSRIPIVAVTGTNGKTTTCRITARILKEAGYTVGLACTDGIYVDGNLIRAGVYSGIAGAVCLFQGRNVEVAVLEISRGTLVERGLAFDGCEAAACINVAADHIGQEGITTLAEMAALKRVVIESARDWAVLNGMDPHCRAMIPYLAAKTVCLVATEPGVPEIHAHVAKGGAALVIEYDGDHRLMTLRLGTQVTVLADVADFPLTWGGLAGHNVENLMQAVGLALGLGVAPEVIRRALRRMGTSIEETPGRLNHYDRLPFPVFLDFAHNAHGLARLARFARGIPCEGRRVLVFWVLERHDENNILDMASAVAPAFELFVCREPAELKEVERGTLSSALSAALQRVGISMNRILVIPDLQDAVAFALRSCCERDVLFIASGKRYRQTWQQLEEYRNVLECPER